HTQLPEIEDNQVLREPIMRNTAPCIAYACHKIYNLNPSASIVIAPSDHLILQEDKFKEAIQKSLIAASRHNILLTLGILPARPDTGYGYIQFTGKTVDMDFKKVKTFTEKPNEELATTFI